MGLKEILSGSRRLVTKKVVLPVAALGLTLTSCSRDIGGTNLINCEDGPKSNSVTLFLPEGESIGVGSEIITATGAPGRIEIKSRGGKFSKIEIVPGEGAIITREDKKVSLRIPENPTGITIVDESKTFTVAGKLHAGDENMPKTQLTISASCLPDKK